METPNRIHMLMFMPYGVAKSYWDMMKSNNYSIKDKFIISLYTFTGVMHLTVFILILLGRHRED